MFAVLLVPAPPQAPLAPLGRDYLRKDGIPINFLLYRYIGTLNAQLYQKYLFPKLVSAGRRHICENLFNLLLMQSFILKDISVLLI